MRWLAISDVAVGQVIASDISNKLGQLILPAGTVLDSRQCALLKAWRVAKVAVQGDEAAGGPPPIASSDDLSASAASTSQPCEASPDHAVMVELAAIVDKLKVSDKPAAASPCPNPTVTAGKPSSAGPPVSAETIVGRVGSLASLPSIYFNVERAINHPSGSAADIGKVLRHDQGMSARLLRVANSAFYGFPKRIEGVEEAIRIIGTRQLHDLVLATVVLAHFKNVDARMVNMDAFWRHSLACGIAARAIAGLRRESNTERFFVAGLLHDIGSLVLYQQLPGRAQVALERHRGSDLALEEAERTVIGCDHGAVGAALLSAWKLPEFFAVAAANHHGVGLRPHTVGTAVVHLADLLVVALNLGSNGEARPPRFCVKAWDLLGIEPSSLWRVAEETISLLSEAQRAFLGEDASV